MITETQQSILEHVRSLKEENAAEHGYSIKKIVESARLRQEQSGRRIIRLAKREQDGADQPATAVDSNSEGSKEADPEAGERSQ